MLNDRFGDKHEEAAAVRVPMDTFIARRQKK
jgi:hypothetical protein